MPNITCQAKHGLFRRHRRAVGAIAKWGVFGLARDLALALDHHDGVRGGERRGGRAQRRASAPPHDR